MTFSAVIIICGIIGLILVNHVNNKLRIMRIGFNEQIRILTERIDQLESENFQFGTENQTDASLASAQPKILSENNTSTIDSTIPFESPAEVDIDTKTEADPTTPEIPHAIASNCEVPSPKYQIIPPSKPEQVMTELAQSIVTYFKTGNSVVKIGLVILFFGVSFLVKFAAEQGYLPIELRLAAAALGGIALTQLGWRLRLKKPDYALAVQGGGIGILFITTFASLKLYSLIPTPLAFLLFVGLAAFTAWLAIIQNSKSLAAFGIIGGFAAPILVSTGQGNHLVLLSYYALLNCGIFAIAWFKSWRILNLLGFIFTYIISAAWGYLSYQSHLFWTVEPFLLIFFLIYVAIPIKFAQRQKTNLKGYVDGTLVFGNAIMAFALQVKLVHTFEYASAFSALIASLFYLSLARYLFQKKNSNFKLLVEAFFALGTIFATITIPLACNGQLTAAVWAVEAAGIYWISLKQDRLLARIFSSLLLFASGFIFITDYQAISFGPPFLNSFYLGCIMVAASSLVISFLGFKFSNKLSKDEHPLIPIFFVLGNLWWIIGGYIEIEYYLPAWWNASSPDITDFPAMCAKNLSTAYVCAGLFLCSILGRKLNWHYLTKISFASIAFMAALALRIFTDNIHPFAYAGYLVWPLAFISYYYILKNNEDLPHIQNNFFKYGHAGALWLLAAIGSGELGWITSQFALNGTAWETASYALVPISLSALILLKSDKISWPIKKYYDDYLLLGVSPILAFTWMWVFFSTLYSTGNATPLLYIPIINPLEAVQAFFMILLPIWLFKIKKIKHIEKMHIAIVLAGTYFLWLNGVLMRAIHQFAGVPFDINSLFSSPLVQMSVSMYWSIIGIALMIVASKKIHRLLWLSGGALMGIVVIKLFLIDLSNSGTIERIVSFISVGIILLLVGYFSPIPPKRQSPEALSNEDI